ncbi:MAG: rRNA adenine dimethyltransferase family protein, partial [Spongiibacteraceae bacterium]|nr:rRNA adenine dimethyltransferase family protein [Spongiibacteraceae bacterium]
GTKAYGRLSVMTQFYCDIEHLFGVPPGAFRPAPKVHSAVVRLTPRRAAPPCDPAQLGRVVTAAFAQRRKTLRNTLKAIADETLLAGLDIDPGARAETLALADFIAITNRITQVSDTTP